MKSGPLFLISALIFLLASSPSLSSSILTTGDDLVLDVWGNPLMKDVEYIISLPFIPTYDQLGGSVKLTSLIKEYDKCEAYVTVAPFDFYNGTRFTFTPVNGRDDFIGLGNPLSIQSPSENPCGDSTVWHVGPPVWFYDNITTGGITNTGPSCLRITKPSHQIASNSHIIEHCSYMCGGANSCHALSYFLSATSGSLLLHLTTSVDLPLLQFVFIPTRCPARSR